MVLNTTCQCKACANISTLDLKFLVHYGTFSISPLRGRDELVGSAVIEVHRLLKNSITEATGVRAYAAYTSAAVDALRLDGFTENLTPHTETDPDLGALTVWVQDMHPLWENTRVDTRLRVDPADTLATVQGELPVPLGVAWELLLRPDCRSILFGSDRQDQSQLRHGRIAEGTVFTCYHGTSTVTTQTVLDLEPLHYLVTEDTTPIPGARMIGEVSSSPAGMPPPSPSRPAPARARGCRALSTTSSAAGCWHPCTAKAWPRCARRSSARSPTAPSRSPSDVSASQPRWTQQRPAILPPAPTTRRARQPLRRPHLAVCSQ